MGRDRAGEKFVVHVKPLMHGKRQNWQRNLMSNCLVQKALMMLKSTGAPSEGFALFGGFLLTSDTEFLFHLF